AECQQGGAIDRRTEDDHPSHGCAEHCERAGSRRHSLRADDSSINRLIMRHVYTCEANGLREAGSQVRTGLSGDDRIRNDRFVNRSKSYRFSNEH
ncbi:hypothetical protein AVEN_30505-1, partial [Araneus ventricosus]